MTARKKASGGQRTATARQRARRARLVAGGLKEVQVVVPAVREVEIKEVAARMVEESQACDSGQDHEAAR